MRSPKCRQTRPLLKPALSLPLIWGWVCACYLAVLLPGRAAEARPVSLTLADLPESTAIHHRAEYCVLCHAAGPTGPIASNVRFGNDYQAGCRCHYNKPDDLRHPTDVILPEAMRSKIPASFPVSNGMVTCVSCHSFAVLCAKERPSISSLRGAPYPDRTTFCFRCHDEQEYLRLNPHHQLDAAGRIVSEKCLYCHTKKPEEDSATFTSVKLIGDLETLCRSCHSIGENHCGGKPHFVKPDLEYQLRMRNLERQYNIVLPLDEEGKLTCITCHNPHEPGVIPKARPGSKGAGESFRHRLPNVLCAECHWHSVSPSGR